MDRRLRSSTCHACLLTDGAERELSRMEADLLGARGHDGTWTSAVCPECGRITAVRDDREGWLAPIEAASLAGVPLKTLVNAMDDGTVEQIPSLDENGGVLVRLSDVLAIARKPRAEPDPPPKRRRPSSTRAGGALLLGALVVVLAAAVWWTSRTQDPVSAATAAETPSAAVGGTSPDDGNVAVAPSPGDPADEPATDPSPAAEVSTPLDGLSVDPARFVTGAGWVSAATSIRNASSLGLPKSEVTFLVLDAAGQTIASARTSVELAPGEAAIVVADAIPLDAAASVARVEVALDPVAFAAASPTGGSLVVQGAVATWDSVTGQIVSTGPWRRSVRIDCAFTREGGKLAGVVSAEFGPVRPNATTPFTVPVGHAVRPVGTAACSAT